MRVPSPAGMPEPLRQALLAVAHQLCERGAQAWLVGGAVRDLALGREPKDIDLATDALPADIERIFPEAKGVGRAFGTMLVVHGKVPVQVTTFRSERGYSDARRPDQVQFGATAAEDAARRDFTCNALFLDPLRGELFDPTGGLADLERGVLRCVGDPVERFREDGLRLLRLARFAADLDLAPDPATLAGARASVDSIVGVSGERVLAELSTIFVRAQPARALRLLHELGVIERALPGLAASEMDRRCAVVARAGEPLGVLEGLCVLFLAEILTPNRAGEGEELERRLGLLRPSRELRHGTLEVGELLRAIESWSVHAPRRSELFRAARKPGWNAAARLARAARAELGQPLAALDAALARLSGFGPRDFSPEPLLAGPDLAAAGIPRGPRWGELLLAAETAQLDGELGTREDALRWLRERAADAR
ncbi:MAG: CCA tRNA nucleotidyltransferase [Planctomycetes bacterium]|nr:CCA tRNA nucleotidyltransferase [Planctomycetota bacterium]